MSDTMNVYSAMVSLRARTRFRAPARCPSPPCRRGGSGGMCRSDFRIYQQPEHVQVALQSSPIPNPPANTERELDLTPPVMIRAVSRGCHQSWQRLTVASIAAKACATSPDFFFNEERVLGYCFLRLRNPTYLSERLVSIATPTSSQPCVP